MTTIRVDPPVLLDISQNIQSSSATLNSVGNNLSGYANGAPSYEGQFGPKVREIAAGGSSFAGQLSGRFSGLASWLSSKATQFLNADNAATASLSSQFSNLSWTSGLAGIFPPFFATGLLSFLSRYFPNGINVWNRLTGNSPVKPQQPVPSPIKPPQQTLDISKIILNQLDYKYVIMNSVSGETLAGYGCLMTVVAMIARTNGVGITPIDVDKWMDSHNYYPKAGGSYMSQSQQEDFLNEVLGKNASISGIYSRNPSQNGLANIKENIEAGVPVILHIDSNINPKDGHFVLAVGLDQDGNYICADPNGGVQSIVKPNMIRSANVYK